ncbi:MAG: heavy-metal-associated domain-containing protein [Maribacter sp.]
MGQFVNLYFKELTLLNTKIMKVKAIYLIFLFAFSSTFLSAQHSEEIFKIIVTVEGMACQEGCADTIADNLRKTEGIKTAEVSFETGEAIVEYDNGLISLNGLKKVITDTKVKDYVYTVKRVVSKTDIEE